MSFLRKHARLMGRIVSALCYLFIVYVLARYFWDTDWNKLLQTDVNWAILAAAMLAETGTRFLLPPIWVFLLREFGQPIRHYWLLNFVYAKAWLGRYLPGKVAWIGGKIYFASQEGIDVKVLTITSPLESVIQLIANLIAGLALMMLFSPTMLDQRVLLFSVISLALLLGCTYPPIFNRLLKFAFFVLRKRELEERYALRNSTFWKTCLLFGILAVASGAPFAILCRAVAPDFDMVGNFFYLVSASTLSGSLGMLALFAPGGLGVREGVLSVFFASLFSKESVLLIVVLLRLSAIVGDIGFFAVSHGLKWLEERSTATERI